MGIWLQGVEKAQHRFLVTSGCLVSKKNAELSESEAFGQKLRYFTDQFGPKGEPHKNEF